MSTLKSHFDELDVPPINSIFKCSVVNLQEYGAFLKIPGFRKNGLLHKQQISKSAVTDVGEVLSKGDEVWCKVISVGSPDDPKISLSMKVVNQGSGKDLDPNGVDIALDERKRLEGHNHRTPKITLEAVFNTVCKKCGTKGHLSQNCFSKPGCKSYDLISDDSDQDDQPQPKVQRISETRDTASTEDTAQQAKKKKNKKDKKKKHKKDHKHKKHKRH